MGDRQVLDRAGGGLAGRGRDRGGAALRDDHAGRPGDLGRPADRPEVVRVLDLVEGDDEGARVAQQASRVGVGIRIDLGDHALVIGRAGEPGQLVGAQLGCRARRGAPGAARARASATGRRP